MKYLILILFLVPLLAWAQPRVKTSETSAIRKGLNTKTGDSIWYEIRITDYDDGGRDIVETPVVDTAQVISFVFTQVIEKLGLATFYLNQYWNADGPAIAHAEQAESLLEDFDSGISKRSISQYRSQIDSATWEVRINGGQPLAATININPTGKRLLLRVAGGSAITGFLAGETRIRLFNYPSQGLRTDLFRRLGVSWVEFWSADRNIKLKKL